VFFRLSIWIIFALLAAISAASVVTLSKVGIKNVPPSLAFAIQAVLIILVSWGTVLWEGRLPEIGKVGRKSWVVPVVAGVLTAVSSLLSFRALSLGNASRVSPITNVSLVFAVALAALFLKEKLTWQIVVGAALMTGGAILIAVGEPDKKAEAQQKNGRPETGTTIYKTKPKA
jgi:transporter family protein